MTKLVLHHLFILIKEKSQLEIQPEYCQMPLAFLHFSQNGGWVASSQEGSIKIISSISKLGLLGSHLLLKMLSLEASLLHGNTQWSVTRYSPIICCYHAPLSWTKGQLDLELLPHALLWPQCFMYSSIHACPLWAKECATPPLD